MTINHITAERTRFKDIKEGDVFLDPETNDFYMKTEVSYEDAEGKNYYLNAVALVGGSLYKFGDEEAIVFPKKAYLTVET